MQSYKFRNNSVILQGDTHSTDATFDLIRTKVPEGSDYVHLGDIGLGFGNISYAEDNALSWIGRFNDLCEDMDIRCYLIRGNHDATYNRIWDSQWSNVFLVKDFAYGVFPNGHQCLMIGGGISVDRYSRRQGIDYWKDELTPSLEVVEKCDIVFSHDCPEHFNHPTNSLIRNFSWYVERDIDLLTHCEKQRKNITDICNRSEAKKIFSGHYHNNIQQEIDGVKYRCLDINELYEFRAD